MVALAKVASVVIATTTTTMSRRLPARKNYCQHNNNPTDLQCFRGLNFFSHQVGAIYPGKCL